MAQLKIDLLVDDHGSAAKLAETEAAVKRIEAANISSANAATTSGAKVVTAAEQQAAAAAKAGSAFNVAAGGVGNFVRSAAAIATGEIATKVIETIFELGKHAVETGRQLIDLSVKSGLSTTELQRMDYVGRTAGVSLEAFGNASYMLGINLDKGKDKTRAAVADLKELHVTYDQLKAMQPDQQFELIAKALSEMTDTQERNRIGSELFGRSWKAIAQAMEEDWQKIADAAHISSREQLLALKDAGAAWDKFVADRETDFRTLLGGMVIVTNNWLDMVSRMGSGDFSKFKQAAYGALLGENPIDILTDLSHDHKELPDWAKADAAKTGAHYGSGAVTTGKDRELSVDKPEKPGKGDKDAERAAQAAAREAERAAEAWKKVNDEMSGISAVRAAEEAMDHVAALGGVTRLTADAQKQLHGTLGKAIEAYKTLGVSVPIDQMKAWLDTLSLQEVALTKLPGQLLAAPIAPLPSMPTAIAGIPGGVLPGQATAAPTAPAAPALSNYLVAALGGAKGFGTAIGNALTQAIHGGGLSGVLGTLGGDVGSKLGGGIAQKLSSMMAGSSGMLSGAFGQLLGSAVQMFLPGIGALLGPVMEKVGHFFSHIFGGNDTKQAIESTFGSYDALRQKLNLLGDEGEKMWVKLTQQTGKNDLESARQQIQAIQDALAKLPPEVHTKVVVDGPPDAAPDSSSADNNPDNYPSYHSGGYLAGWRIAHRGGLAPDEIPIIGQTGEFMMSRRGVATAGLDALRRLNRGQSIGGGGGTAILEVDGRVFAEVVVPHIPGVVRRYQPRSA